MRDPVVAEREWSGVSGFIGEGGAYISDIWASAEGAVSPTRTCLTLSDWTCVLWRDEWRATRRGEEGDKEELLLDVMSSSVHDGDSCHTYMLSSSSRRLIASCTAESHRFAAAMRSLSALKV